MSPPVYSDLGKQARDIFGKGYHFGLWKLECKSKTSSGVEFTANTSSNQGNKLNGSLETKYKFKERGLSLTEKWNTDNTLATEVSVEDQLAKGLKLTLDTKFSPNTGKKDGLLKMQYKQSNVSATGDMTLDAAGPLFNFSSVVGYQGWLAGFQAAYDVSKSKLTKSNFAVGYDGKDYILHANINDGEVFGWSVYHKMNENTEAGCTLGWVSTNNTVNFAVGTKHRLDKNTYVRAKVNNSAQLGLSYQQNLRHGVVLTLSGQLDTKNIDQGGHKVGLGLEINA